MKKIFNKKVCSILFTIIISGFLNVSSYAQGQYNVTVSPGRYVEIGSGNTLTYLADQDGYYQDFPFKFPVFQRTADFNLHQNPTSAGIYISKVGLGAVYESPGYQNTIVFQPFENASFRVNPSITTVSTKLEGTMPNRVLKVQWKDLLKDSNSAEKVNFQVWLHEKDSTISYHYGPNTLATRATWGLCGIIVLDGGFSKTLNEIHVEGSPEKPTIYRNITDFSYPTLDSFPSEGTVITFRRQSPTSIKPKLAASYLNVFPNPCTSQLNITHSLRSGTVVLYDILGNVVLENTLSNADLQLDVNALRPGIYSLVLKGENSIEVRKIIKQ